MTYILISFGQLSSLNISISVYFSVLLAINAQKLWVVLSSVRGADELRICFEINFYFSVFFAFNRIHAQTF